MQGQDLFINRHDRPKEEAFKKEATSDFKQGKVSR